jgi:hypothetical protein
MGLDPVELVVGEDHPAHRPFIHPAGHRTSVSRCSVRIHSRGWGERDFPLDGYQNAGGFPAGLAVIPRHQHIQLYTGLGRVFQHRAHIPPLPVALEANSIAFLNPHTFLPCQRATINVCST